MTAPAKAAKTSAPAIPLRERLIVGLDVPDVRQAAKLVETLGDTVNFYKIGYQLALSGGKKGENGLDFARDLAAAGKKVFLDLKLLDIDNTIAKAVENAAKFGVSMLTLHAYPKAMRAAAQAAKDSPLCLLGVTVLTSMDAADLAEAGYAMSPQELVLRRAEQAKAAGIGGLVASAAEAAALRKIIGAEMVLATPGIRPQGAEKGDQKRVMTPQAALRAGADYLVVGRPIVQAAEPKSAAEAILADMAQALHQ